MSDALASARKFLESLQRFDLSMLLSECSIAIRQVKGGLVDDEWYSSMLYDEAVVFAPTPIDEAIKALQPEDRKRIAEAIANGYHDKGRFDDVAVEAIRFSEATGMVLVLAELMIHRNMMIDVATGGPRIQEINDYYIAREVRLREMMPADITYDNPDADLWAWYKHWQELGGYAGRRAYVRELFTPVITAVAKRSTLPIPERQATGWERVDRALAKARSRFDTAAAEEDFQGVGHLCREVIISLAQAVFDPETHPTVDGVEASKTDAKRMLDAYVASMLPGSSNEEVRAHSRASLALANGLQHRRTATRQMAALCLEATSSTVAVLSIIAREP
jgi:hypothetical protein